MENAVTTLGETPSLFDGLTPLRVEEMLAERDGTTVYRVTSVTGHYNNGLGADWGGRFRVGPTLFAVVLAPGVVPAPPTSPNEWEEHRAWLKVLKRAIQAAVALVGPDVAGFPEWRRIRRDDVRVVDEGAGPPPWGVAQVWSYRRQLQAAKAQSRRPYEFSPETKRRLLVASQHRCERCGGSGSLEVDHIVPLAFGGSGIPENGMVLCTSCHRAKTKLESQAYGSPYRCVLVTNTNRPNAVLSSLRRGLLQSDHLRAVAPPYYVWVNECDKPRRFGPFATFADARECSREQLAVRLRK